MKNRNWIAILVLVLLTTQLASGQTRIKDIADVEGISEIPLIGYGLVVGLDGTGDSPRSLFTTQAMANMLERFGMSIKSSRVRVRNVAGVMVTVRLDAFAKQGQRIDVTVSSLGDSRSLQGGTLLLTPLVGTDEEIYGVAQGPISIGGFAVESAGVSIRQNVNSVGRIPSGFLVERNVGTNLGQIEYFRFALRKSDFTTARRMADAINAAFALNVASALDPISVEIDIPPDYPGGAIGMISDAEMIEIEPDVAAKVVINERTGTVVIGSNVRLANVAISHGALSISIVSTPVISQPGPFAPGRTVVQRATQIMVQQEGTGVIVIERSTNVGDVAGALNSLGVTPREIISIFQALKEAGALQADLVII